LLVEDDTNLSKAITYALGKEGYTVDVCGDGDDALRMAMTKAHDLILLDRMLPNLEGASLIRKARAQGLSTPVLMMTALGEVDDRVEGLDAGADDYIVKPIAVKELLARVRAFGRRPKGWNNSTVLTCGKLEFDPGSRNLKYEDESIPLTPKETALLAHLMKHEGQVVTREALLSHVWGSFSEVEDGILDTYIRYVRKRLQTVGCPHEIVTHRGTGYSLQEKKHA